MQKKVRRQRMENDKLQAELARERREKKIANGEIDPEPKMTEKEIGTTDGETGKKSEL